MMWILDALVSLALLSLGSTADSKGSYTSSLYGFRVDAPSKEWSVETLDDSRTGALVVAITRKDASTGVSASVRADLVDATVTAKSALEKDLAFVKGKDAYGPPRTYELRLAGVEGAALELVYTSPEKKSYHAKKAHVVHDGVHYSIEAYVLESELALHEKAVERIFESFAFVPVSKSERAKRGWHALAAKCGSEIEWCATWDQAVARARAEKKPVLVSVNMRAGFALADEAMTSAFMDEDVVELARARFVCMRMQHDTEAPFRSQSSYGIGPFGFGVALLVVSPDGAVVDEDESLIPQVVDGFLRASLMRHPEFSTGVQPSEDARGLESARACARRGELERALAMLGDDSSEGARVVRARCQRRLAEDDAALETLDALGAPGRARSASTGSDARASPSASADKLAIELERGAVLLRLGRIADARGAFDRALAADAHSTAAMYGRGACAYFAGKDAEARAVWEKLAAEHPSDRWAWAAAAELTGGKLEIGLRWNPRTIGAETLRALRSSAPQAWPSSRAREAADAAVRYLVREQRADGSWHSPSDVRDYEMPMPDPFVDSISALAGEALLEHLDDADAKRAVDRARRFVLDSIARAKRSPRDSGYMDYEVWSRSCALRFFASCVAKKIGSRDEMRDATKWIVAELARKQRPGGGFSYYVTSDLATAAEGASDQQSISFVTAAVVHAFLRARESGLVSTDASDGFGILAPALACLERARGDDGVFEYMIPVQGRAPAQSPTPAGAAGRGPACELALLRAKHGDLDHLRGALAHFREHASTLARERGKVLMHCGPEGQGCHYILFDYWTAALAVRELPESERAPYRALLVDDLMQLRSEEGAFRDTPILGWDCGTALALLALDALGS
jgi:tetratricopeptide (TPR) repeat protein